MGGSSRVSRLQDIPIIAQLAQEKGVSVYQIVLSWLRAKSPCIVPIPGASKLSSIEDSVKSVEVKLSPQEVEDLDRKLSS